MTEPEAATDLRARLRRLLPTLLLVAVFAALIAPALDPSVQLYYRDTGRLHYPVKKFMAEELRKLHLPLWDPWTESGTSLLGQLTEGLFHPFTLLYLALPFDLAFKLNHLLTLPLAALGTYWLARQLRISGWGAAAAGVTYGGCGFLVSMASGNVTYALGPAGVPIALAALLAFEEKRTPLRLLGAALALALEAAAGDPQSMLIAGVIGTALLVARALSAGPPQQPARTRLASGASAGLRAAAWGAAALALSAPVALPAAARLRELSRKNGLSDRERRAFLVTPLRLPGYLVPRAFDDPGEVDGAPQESNPYPEFFGYETDSSFSDSILIGAPALLLGLLGCFAGRRGRFLFAGGLFFVAASTGEALGVQELLATTLPGFRYFRYAEKFAAPASLLIALAAGVGLDFALRGTRRASRALAGAACGLSAASAAGALLLSWFPAAAVSLAAEMGRTHSASLAARLVGSLRSGLLLVAALALVLAAVAWLREGRLAPLTPALAFCCCAATVLACNTDSLLVGPVALLRGPFRLADFLVERAGPSPGRWRLFTYAGAAQVPASPLLGERLGNQDGLAQALHPQFDSLAGLESASIYFSAIDSRYMQAISAAPFQVGLVLGIRFFLAMPKDLAPGAAARRGFVRLPRGYWLRALPLRPRAFAVGAVRPVPVEQAFQALADPAFAPEREALVDAQDAPLVAGLPPGAPALPAKTSWSRPASDRIEVAVDDPAPALLVVAEHFDPGWRAQVDGRPAPVMRVDSVALGVPVPAGRHRVELTFHPVGFAVGMWVLVATLTGFAGWAWVRRTRPVSR